MDHADRKSLTDRYYREFRDLWIALEARADPAISPRVFFFFH